MSEQSAKPYLIRAICEWCADNGLTPYLAVKVERADARADGVRQERRDRAQRQPRRATRKLTIDNDWIQFTARFNGVSQEVSVPMSAVAGIFAKETGYGFAFTLAPDPVASLAAATAPEPDIDAALEHDRKDARTRRTQASAKPRPSHLQIIK